MSKIGSIGWIDLTVPKAEEVRDFYSSVVGWDHSEVDMGGYSDYCMNGPDDGESYAGVCHARGGNEGIPPAWIIYINVANLDQSMDACIAGGGKIIGNARKMGTQGRYCFIEDPAGAICALFESTKS